MSTNKVNLSLDEIILKRKNQFQPNTITNKRSFLNNRRNFGERRRYAQKDHSNFGNNKFNRKWSRNKDNVNSSHSFKEIEEENASSEKEKETFEKPTDNDREQSKGARLIVSNLQRDVVNSELRKIFSTVGPLKRCGIHWDELGFSKGTADVEYVNSEDAEKALMFDTAEIEGVQMKVEFHRSPKKELNLRIIKKRPREEKFKNFKIFNRERNLDSIFEKRRIRLGTKKYDDMLDNRDK